MTATVLVDRRNWDKYYPIMVAQLRTGNMPGLDIETHNERAHPALKLYRRGSVFDPRRTTLVGLSLYVDECKEDEGYYINIGHKDVENRVPWPWVKELLSYKPDDVAWVIHNAPFEITMLKNCVDFEIDNYLCSLQLAVSAYNDDTYNIRRFHEAGLGEMARLIPDIAQTFADWVPGSVMDEEQSTLFRKITGKESDAAHSYNGLVNSVRYGFSLKEAVASHFGYKMKTYEEVLNGKAHMGELTGEETASYGADDAIWCVKLAKHLIGFIGQNGGRPLLKTFMEQENPAVRAYADVWLNGWRVNLKAVQARTKVEQHDCADLIRELKTKIAARIDKSWIDSPPSDYLIREKWYREKDAYKRYRQRIVDFLNAPDSKDDDTILSQISGSVPKSVGHSGGNGPNFTHYMIMRTLFHDMLGLKPIYVKGSIVTDGEARGRLADRVAGKPEAEVITAVNKLAGVEQRMKLYLIPYSHLVDPETKRIYPQLSSMLNTRRLGARFPNPMQLSKRTSTYVRGFYEADDDDHLIVSQDWSQIELVLIGDQSRDESFRKVYGQLPYADLHVGSAADLLAIEVEGMNEEAFKALQFISDEDFAALPDRVRTNFKGLPIPDGKAAYKYWRNELGKVSNFGYWYSGALSDIGERMGWSSNTMWDAVERYRARFPQAEEWRVDTIHRQARDGFLTLPDEHRRYMYEATPLWAAHMKSMFARYNNVAVMNFGNAMVKRLQGRAGNQGVNALIQGSCATLAKRSIVRIREMIGRLGLRARFLMPIHDEMVWNVHKDDALVFIKEAKKIMINHPEIIQTLPMDCTSSIGKTFEPFDKVKAPYGQIELDEAPDFLELPKGKKLNDAQILQVIEYLTK